MVYEASQVKMSYQMMQMLPETDSTYIQYQGFKEKFGQDGSVMLVGLDDKDAWKLKNFTAWYDLTNEIRNISGVQEVISTARIFKLAKDDSLKQFVMQPVMTEKPQTQLELDSLKKVIFDQKLFDGLLYNKESGVSLMMITLEKSILNSAERIPLIYSIEEKVNNFQKSNNCKVHISGLPYIRTVTTKMGKDEITLFMVLSILIATLILYFFFRSFKVIIFPLIIVVMSVAWAFGSIALLGYELTMLTGVIPPLIVVICVENCVFLLNKYHAEYIEHGDKKRALAETILRIGNANFLTNATTAAGFAAFLITGNQTLTEFGVVASINILTTYIMTLVLIPVFFSFLPAPTPNQTKHLSLGYINKLINGIIQIVETKKVWIYSFAITLFCVGLFGMAQLETSGNVVDEVPKDAKMYTDLLALEKHFNGVMPLEIMIDTKKPRGAMKLSTLKRIEKLQLVLATYPELSKPISLAQAVKTGKQAFYGGNPAFYAMPNSNELAFMVKYLPNGIGEGESNPAKGFIDDSQQVTRISVQMANIGTKEIRKIKEDLIPKIDKIFPPDRYTVTLTGTSLVFLEGTNYLTKNLYQSLLLALAIICALMAFLFSSFRMIIISLIPNLLPLIMTAGMMGYIGIPIKPSTILIFSVALGISVDNAIHFLSRYRLQLILNNWKIGKSVIRALRETGYSMVYSSVVLFFGFGIFAFSSFGGTKAMGYLVAFTLLMAMLSNLFLLPSMLLSTKRTVTTKNFKKPVVDFLDGNELADDIDLDKWKGKKK